MSRKKGPALYELISQQRPHNQKLNDLDCIDSEDNLKHNILSPGRSIRLSLGTFGICLAICIALVLIAYTMGFQRGNSIAEADYGNRLFTEFGALSDDDANNSSRLTEITTFKPLKSDLRVSGEFYYILVQAVTEPGAVELATFCRDKGLETYVVSGNNTRFYRVIAFPGFVNRLGATATRLRSQIDAVGQQWAQHKSSGGKGLQDAYPSLYN